jgi:predicted DCC family thiol-disulfide oxidoreductase YuxK
MREPIVVFDTNCVLCSGMVAFILAHERNRVLRFVGAWSDEGLALAARHHFSKSDLDQTFWCSAVTRHYAGPTPALRF